MRTKPIANLTQTENVDFYVERKSNFGFYEADFWEVVLPVEGNTEISSDGRKRVVTRGLIAFLAPGVKRRVTLRGEDGEYISIRIKTEAVKNVIEQFDSQSFTIFSA